MTDATEARTRHSANRIGRCAVTGCVGRPRQWSLAELQERATVEAVAPIHCVSSGRGIYDGPPAVFAGASLADLLGEAQPIAPSGATLLISRAPAAIGSPTLRHETPVETELALTAGQIILAWTLNGRPLPYANGGPLRAVVDGRGYDGQPRYFYKSLKWIEEIEVLAEPIDVCRRGTWERPPAMASAAPWGRPRSSPSWLGRRRDAFPDWIEAARHQAELASWIRQGDVSRLISGQLHRCIPDFSRAAGWNPSLRFQTAEFVGSNCERSGGGSPRPPIDDGICRTSTSRWPIWIRPTWATPFPISPRICSMRIAKARRSAVRT